MRREGDGGRRKRSEEEEGVLGEGAACLPTASVVDGEGRMQMRKRRRSTAEPIGRFQSTLLSQARGAGRALTFPLGKVKTLSAPRAS